MQLDRLFSAIPMRRLDRAVLAVDGGQLLNSL